MRLSCLMLLAIFVASGARAQAMDSPGSCSVELVVLGVAQDAGMPQIGNPADPAWRDQSLARLATSLAVVDHRDGRRYLFEATPDLRVQLQRLDQYTPASSASLGLDGIFLTHAHIGHYAGLMFLGHESAGARDVPVYAMPRMTEFLSSNGPWDQLVRYGNIRLHALADGESITLAERFMVTPQRVPHRDEYSETVGYSIRGPGQSIYFLPDIDSWDRWAREFGVEIEAVIRAHDIAYLDATFYDDRELPGRDMSAIPHPRIAAMMDRFDALPVTERQKVRFIHLNHTNPARYDDSPQRRHIDERGYQVAEEGEVVCLD